MGKTVLGIIKPELSAVRLRLATDGELDADGSTFFAMNTASHYLQRAVKVTAAVDVILEGRCRAEWNAGRSSLAVTKLDSLTLQAVTTA